MVSTDLYYRACGLPLVLIRNRWEDFKTIPTTDRKARYCKTFFASLIIRANKIGGLKRKVKLRLKQNT